MLTKAFNSIMQSIDSNTDPRRAIKKVVMKSLGERDYSAQKAMHHLLSLKLHTAHHLRIFPTYSPNPKGPNFGLYCKYQLLRYKPWRTTQNNAWGEQEATDEVLINSWQEFLQTPYGQCTVPDWFDKLQAVIQNQEQEIEPSEEQERT